MRLPETAHTELPWRVHELTRGFRLQDVWAFRAPGAGAEDFSAMVDAIQAAGGPARQTGLVRALFAARWKLGALLGWDKPKAGITERVPSLRDRLPHDLSPAPSGSDPTTTPFTTVYELDDECARELANKTVHAVMHLGWVPAASGEYELRMAVLVKPNGLLGRLYMAAIAPFRHLIVYPALTRQWERAWRERGRAPHSEERGVTSGGGAMEGVAGAVGADKVPASVRALSSLPDADYVDMFTLATSVSAGAEQWARAMFGDVPSVPGRLIWRGVLGLRLSRGRSPDTVAGWRLVERGEDWVRLEAASWFLTGNLVVRVSDGRVSLATFLRYDRGLAAVIWPPSSAVHRGLIPGALREAAERLRALPAGVASRP
ncbi:DUF2867 domain-containing protein [Streptomyces sp. NPDC003032]